MSEIKLNEQQIAFVNNQNGNMLVSASAGSGKTTTMILKLIDLIVNKNVPVQNLLVVTFTDAAAQEMKQKLYLELIKVIKSNNFTEEKLNFLYAQLDDIMVADIGTVHSVCKKIVTKYFYAVSVEPNFKIIADVEYQTLFNTALNNVFNTYITTLDEEFYNVFLSFNEKRNFTKLKNIITDIYTFLTEQTNPEGWFYRVCDQITEKDLSKNTCANYLFNYYRSNLSGYINDFEELYKQAKYVNEKHEQIVLGYLNFAKQVSKTNNFIELTNLVNNVPNFIKLSPVKDPEFYDYYETLKLTTKTFKEVVEKAKENTITNNVEKIQNDCDQLLNIYKKLFEITNKVSQEFSRLKQNIGVLDFSDLQKLTLTILEDQKIKEELKKHYTYIFVDEYQDTNQIQEDIILSLTSGNNLYMIGDVKQSIYAFRQCKPEIFLSKYNLFKADGVLNKLLNLNENYRSSKNIINFANMIFNEIITTKTIGINYKSDAQLKSVIADEGNVKLNIIDVQKDGGSDSEFDYDKNEVEAQVVLQEISNVLNKPYFNHKLNCVKYIEYKDIAILTRDSRGFVIDLYKLLADHKIPVSANFKKGIFNSNEVSIIYSLLKLVANQTNEIDLATVLHSNMFNVTNNELAQIKIEGKYDNFYENVLNYAEFGTNASLCDKISSLFAELDLIKHKLSYYTIFEVVEYVINKYDLINHYYSLPDGLERVTNLKVFCELLKNELFNYNLNKCLEFLDSLSKKDNFVISTESGDNSIKILTMHKSKGLEYPCVILCNMGKSFNTSAFRADMVINEELGIGINLKDASSRIEYNTIQKKANVLFKTSSELNEQIRLLYVAITRAKNYLTIVGSYDLSKLEFNQNRSVLSSTNFLDLIFKGLKTNINSKAFLSKSNFDINYNNSVVCNVQVTKPIDVAQEFQYVNNNIETSNYNIDLVNNVVKNVTAKTINKGKLIATKNSVSGLMDEENYVNDNELDLTLGFNEESQNDDALKLGSAYHLIMQNIDYFSPLNVQQIIDDLISKSQIDNQTAKLINPEQIYNAYNTVKQFINKNTKVLCEQQFLLKTNYSKINPNNTEDSSVLIQGVVDLVLINNNDAIIIDFKTNKTKNFDMLANKYGLQLQCYALACEEGLNVKVREKYLYLFNYNKLLKV